MVPTAREQGFPDLAERFETLAKVEKTMLVGSSTDSNPSGSRGKRSSISLRHVRVSGTLEQCLTDSRFVLIFFRGDLSRVSGVAVSGLGSMIDRTAVGSRSS